MKGASLMVNVTDDASSVCVDFGPFPPYLSTSDVNHYVRKCL